MPDIQSDSQPIGTSSASEPNVYSAEIVPTDSNANYTPDDGTDTMFDEYAIRSRWVFENNILAGAIAGKPPAQGNDTEFIRVAYPQAKLRVEWSVSKVNDTPDLPDPNLNDTNYVLMKSEFDLDKLEGNADGTLLITCSGEYTYGTKIRSQNTMGYPRPLYITVVDNTPTIIQPVDFVQGVINYKWPNVAASGTIPSS